MVIHNFFYRLTILLGHTLNAKRIRCGWHLIHTGWERHVDNASQFNNVSMTEYTDKKTDINNLDDFLDEKFL